MAYELRLDDQAEDRSGRRSYYLQLPKEPAYESMRLIREWLDAVMRLYEPPMGESDAPEAPAVERTGAVAR